MIIILKGIGDYVFSSSLKNFVFATSLGYARFKITMGEQELLNEIYSPDNSGNVTIYDLDELVMPYLTQNLCETFSYSVSDNESEKTGTFTVLKSVADISTTASDFISSFFLNLLFGNKETARFHKEFVHLIPVDACSVTATCRYFADNAITTETTTITSFEASRAVETVDVSPSQFIKADKKLISYAIKAGNRLQEFDVKEYPFDAAPILIFTNSFGCQETFYCMGTHELAPELTREASAVGGMYRNYKVDEDRIFKANTGILSPSMASLADDLLRSKEIYLLDGETVGNEITIIESEAKRSNDADNLPSFTFSYRYSQKNQLVVQIPRAGRVFDNTFDNTFE